MRLHVAFLPSLVRPARSFDPAPFDSAHDRQVCIVVDVIRASTSLVTLLDRGASEIFIAPDVQTARGLAKIRGGLILAGEEEGLAPAGFHYGNSPVELSQAEVDGRPVAFVTTNGTAAIHAVERSGPVLIGALRNAAAVCREAAQAAQGGEIDLTVVCAGREGAFGIDDAYTAGCLVEGLLQMGSYDFTDGAHAALRLYRSEPDPLPLFRQSAAGQNVTRLGLAHDVAYCAERDRSSAVPRLGRELRLLDGNGLEPAGS